MLETRARKKLDKKLRKLSKKLDRSNAVLEYYEASLKEQEENNNKSTTEA